MRGYAVAFFVGGVFTVTVENVFIAWSARRDVKRHGQKKSG